MSGSGKASRCSMLWIRSWDTDLHDAALTFVRPGKPWFRRRDKPSLTRDSPRSIAQWLLSCVADSPDGLRAVIGYEQRAILGDGDAHGPSPNVAIIHDESCHEIFIFAGSVAGLMQGHANDFIAHANRAIPRAMFSSENIALVFLWELFAVIKRQFQRRVVRMKDDIRRNDFVFQLGMFAFVARVLMAAHIPPGPTVKTAVLHVGDIVGNQIVT